MSFPANAYILAFVGALGCSLALFPLIRAWCCKAGLIDDPGHRKIHDHPIPLAGGITIFMAMLIPLVLAWVWAQSQPASFGASSPPAPSAFAENGASGLFLGYAFSRRAVQLAGILLGATGMLLVGIWDDKFELKPLPKFGAQLAVALVVAACGVRITLFVPSIVFSYVVTVLWILTLINAFNFMDNMNGLCTGLGVIGSASFAVIAQIQGHYLVASMGFLAAGALLGFLPYNFPSAKAFLGDGGSHLVGYLLAVMAVLSHFYTPERPRPWAVMTPLFVLAVPLLDMASVVIIRWRLGKPFYVGDTNHVSHQLVRAGLSRRDAVLTIWSAALLFGGLAMLLIFLSSR